jgi:purine-nucleoside phosphorylase
MAKESISASIALAEGHEIAKVVLMPGDPLRAQVSWPSAIWKTRCASTPCATCWATPAPTGARSISVMGQRHGRALHRPVRLRSSTTSSSTWTPSSASAPPAAWATTCTLRDVVIAMGASTNSAYGAASTTVPRHPVPPLADYDAAAPTPWRAAEALERARRDVGPVYHGRPVLQLSTPRPAPCTTRSCATWASSRLRWRRPACTGRLQRLAIKRRLSILTISDHLFTGEALTAEDRQESFHDMMEVALETAWQTVQ